MSRFDVSSPLNFSLNKTAAFIFALSFASGISKLKSCSRALGWFAESKERLSENIGLR
jgi:hypothetical protein